MNEQTQELILFIAMGEMLIVMAAFIVFMLLRIRKHKKADQQAASDLAKNVQDKDKERRQVLLTIFQQCSDMDEAGCKEAVESFIQREHAFYKTLTSVYVDRDAKGFVKLSSGLEEMITPYAEIAQSTSKILQGGDETVEALQKENEELEKELDDSKEVLDELLNEFSASFDKKGEGILPETIKAKQTVDESDSNETISDDQPVTTENAEADQDEQNDDDAAQEFDLDLEDADDEPIENNVDGLEADAAAEAMAALNTDPADLIPVVDEIANPVIEAADEPIVEVQIDLEADIDVDETIKNDILDEIESTGDGPVVEEEIAAELIVEESAPQEAINKSDQEASDKKASKEAVDDILSELDIA